MGDEDTPRSSGVTIDRVARASSPPASGRSDVRAMRHTLVLSDVHLGEEEPTAGPWMFYRQRRFFPDPDLQRLVAWILSRISARDALELVLDGDVFELEGPRVVDGVTVFDEAPRTEEDALDRTARIVRDHDGFFGALAKVVELGHRVIFVAGNHDAQLAFPGVQQLVRRAIAERAAPAEGDETALARVQVEPWFFQTRDGLHVEHGHQYDTYCAFRDPLRPFDPTGREIWPTVGSLAFRTVMSRMGYFNAYDERSYMLPAGRYFMHWARHYLFSRRSMVYAFVRGAIRIVQKLLSTRPSPELLRAMRQAARLARAAHAEAHALPAHAVEAHAALFAPPADEDPYRVIQEFHLDHALLGAIGLAGIVTAAFKPRLGLAMAVGALAIGVAQEVLRPRRGTSHEQARVDRTARKVSRIYGAKAVVFGHTHAPHAEVERGVLYANTGTWAPQGEGDGPAPDGRPVVWLRRAQDEDAPRLEGGLYRWREGALQPEVILGDEPEPLSQPLPAPGDAGDEGAQGEEELGLPLPEPVPA
jgi:UDP-2,3-diacylglucosamine pyrophosphatase LpxH